MNFHKLTRSSVSQPKHIPTDKITHHKSSICNLTSSDKHKSRHQRKISHYLGHRYYKTAVIKQLFSQVKDLPKHSETLYDFEILNLTQANMPKLVQLKQKIFPLFTRARSSFSRRMQSEIPITSIYTKKDSQIYPNDQLKFRTEPIDKQQKNVMMYTHNNYNGNHLRKLNMKTQKMNRIRQSRDFPCNRWQVDSSDFEFF